VSLTEFQKEKQREWDEFSKKHPFSWKQELWEDKWFIISFLVILYFALFSVDI